MYIARMYIVDKMSGRNRVEQTNCLRLCLCLACTSESFVEVDFVGRFRYSEMPPFMLGKQARTTPAGLHVAL